MLVQEKHLRAIATLILVFMSVSLAIGGEPAGVTFKTLTDRLEISVAGQGWANYVFRDKKTLRPYFTNVSALTGQQVTRHHPPRPGVDSNDHATMHPGIHLAFGDLGRVDFWRNRGRVLHDKFVDQPTGGLRAGQFSVRNRYVDGDRTVCVETCRHEILVRPGGVLLIYDSRFESGESDFYFGDQEEMGLGVRVARELRVEGGKGWILDSEGRRNGKAVWGKTARWCAYGGVIGQHHVGLALMPHPQNFRPSWFHARDYGFLAANPFGRRAFTRGKSSRLVVKRGKTFRLRYGVLVYSVPAGQQPDLNAAFRDYVGLPGKIDKTR